jgi:hypothetical protein
MYRKPRFLEELHAIREEMSRECDYDIDLFVEMVKSGKRPGYHLAEKPSEGDSSLSEEESHKSVSDD